MKCSLGFVQANDHWEGGNSFARSADLLESINQSKLIEWLVDQAIWNLKKAGASSDLKTLLGQYVKVNAPKPKDSGLASFYFLVGTESTDVALPVPKLSVVRMGTFHCLHQAVV